MQQINFTNLVDLLHYRVEYQSRDIAFTFLPQGELEEVNWTYQELDLKARAIAAVLQSLNLRGERALLLYQPGLDFIAAFFGCLYARITAVPVYPPKRNHHKNRLQAIVTDAQAAITLTTTSVFENFEKTFTEQPELNNLRTITTDKIDPCEADGWQPLSIDSNDLAFLQYTSGSTGAPKGVMISHGNLLHNLTLIHKSFEHTASSHGVIWLPPYHDMGLIGGVLQPIYGGFPVTLMPPVAFLQKPIRWLQAISRYKATTSGGPNFAYDLCVNKIQPEQLKSLDLSSWELAFTGAEPIRAETLERFARTFAGCGFRKEAFYPCYGMAETTLLVCGGLKAEAPIIRDVEKSKLLPNSVKKVSRSKEDLMGIVSSGRSWLNQVAIANPESLIQCRDGEVGEIWVKGESVAKGYWNQPQLTQQTFNAYLTGAGEGPFLRTGDLGFLQDGELFVTGRIKDMIIIRGQNYYSQDIELTVQMSHRGLRRDCGAAFAVEVRNTERLVIVQEVERSYLKKLDVPSCVENISKVVTARHGLKVYATFLVKTGSIPKTSSGKIQRYACKNAFLNGTLNVVEAATVNPRHSNNYVKSFLRWLFKNLLKFIKYLLKKVQADIRDLS
jgi:acyl-CoA synthetase (AMP-forming)/AMP-acid ligase II